jgi:thiol peroxidase
MEQKGLVTFQGNPLTLMGDILEPGMVAPHVTLTGNDLNPTSLDSYKETALILATVPSLDTSVCSEETKRFNQEAESFPGGVKLVVASMDLPFAQQRWAKEHDVTRIIFLSDHKEASLGQSFGILIKELRLLARTVFVLDKQGKVIYKELVKEITEPPNYEAALNAVREAM